MAENSASEAESADKTEAAKNDSVDNKETATKPLQMSFADWKKTKEATRNVRKPFKNENNNKQQPGFNRNHNNINNNSYNNNNNNNNNSYPPLSRPPPLPFPLMSMSFNNFGPGPGPCGPSTMTPPGNMSNMGNMGPGPSGRKHRPLQPPPFWEDMMSPQLRPPPIQPPMPKCPSLWNLVPKEKQKIHSSKQNHQPNKKYKSSNNNNSNSDNALLDAALMPPPPPPGESGANSTSNLSSSKSSENRVVKKNKNGGTFIQIDGKWIQRPEAPLPLEEAPPGTKEDRQRQWREYRQAMKPFKNREFHNYKRTVQRLSKIPREDLDEKQLERLQKAEEYIGAHKAMLTIKHAEQWVQQSSQKSDGLGNSAGSGQASGQIPVTGQVYVRKPANAAWHKNSDPNTFQRAPIRKQVFGTGRAIKGGVGGELGVMPPLPAGSVTGISQYANYFDPTQQGVNSGLYGQDMASSSNNISINNSSSFYSSYNSSFVKGGTLLPP